MTIQTRLPPGKYRLRIEDYERLAETGAFGGQKTELIEGDVVVMSPQYRPHGMVKMRLYDELRDRLRDLGSPLRPVVEFSLAVAVDSMPDPDIMLTSKPDGPKAVPLASIALVIEVSDTTLSDDLGTKQRLYAAADVQEYWVADVKARVIHQMWGPAGGNFSERRTVAFGSTIISTTIDRLEVTTTSL